MEKYFQWNLKTKGIKKVVVVCCFDCSFEKKNEKKKEREWPEWEWELRKKGGQCCCCCC